MIYGDDAGASETSSTFTGNVPPASNLKALKLVFGPTVTLRSTCPAGTVIDAPGEGDGVVVGDVGNGAGVTG